MKKAVLLIFLLLLSLPLFAQEGENADLLKVNPEIYVPMETAKETAVTPDGFTYEVYSRDEFPVWAQKLRRFEIIFFGGIPLTYAFTNIAFSAFSRTADFRTAISISAGASLIISTIDFILGEIR